MDLNYEKACLFSLAHCDSDLDYYVLVQSEKVMVRCCDLACSGSCMSVLNAMDCCSQD